MKKLTLILSLLLSTCFACAQWTQQASGTTYDLNDVFFIDNLKGFVVGDDGIFVGQNGTCKRTLDGGANWVNQNIGVMASFEAIQFVNPNLGFIVGENDVFIKTINGGNTWSIDTVVSMFNWLKALHFINDSTGWVAGNNGEIYFTNDTGATWANRSIGSPFNISNIHFFDENNGIVCGYSFGTYRTFDGGLNWLQIFPGFNFQSFHFINNMEGYAIIYGSSDIAYTFNKGATWQVLSSPLPTSYSDIFFTSVTTGYLVGSRTAKTTNSGNLIESLAPNPPGALLGAVYFPSSNIGYAVGENGLIMKTSNGGGSTFPYATFTPSQTVVCANNTVFFTNNGVASNMYQWLIDGVLFSSSYNTSYLFAIPDSSFTISLVAFNGVNYDTASVVITTGPFFNNNLISTPTTTTFCQEQIVQIKVDSSLATATYHLQIGAIVVGTSQVGDGGTIYLDGIAIDSTTTFTVYASQTLLCGFNQVVDSHTVNLADSILIVENEWDSVPITLVGGIVKMSFLDNNIGYALEDGFNFNSLHKTIDGGYTWTSVPIIGFSNSRGDIDFIDANNGIIAKDWLFRTADGGNTLVLANFNSSADYISVDYVSQNVVYAVANNSMIEKSIDGGYNYFTVLSLIGNFPLNEIKCVSDDTCYCFGGQVDSVNSSFVLKTVDGGVNWIEVSPSRPGVFLGSSYLFDGSTGFVITSTEVLKTVNGGNSWSKQVITNSSSNYLGEIQFTTSDTGYTVSRGGFLYKTVNSGDCWQLIDTVPFNTTYFTSDINFPTPNVGYIGGNPGVGIGAIYKTTKGRFTDFNLLDTLTCVNDTLYTSNLSYGNDSCEWYFDNVLFSNSRNTSVVFTTSGLHKIDLVCYEQGVLDTSSYSIFIKPIPNVIANVIPNQTICAGDSITFYGSGYASYVWNNGVIDNVSFVPPSSAIYTVTVTDSVNFCSNSDTVNLIVGSIYNDFYTITICDGDSILLGGAYQTTNGIYKDTIQTIYGCDSIISTSVIVNYPTTTTMNVTECSGSGYTSPSGNYVWFADGTYMDTIPNTFGCDNVITINLSFGNSSSSTTTATVCVSYTSPSGQYIWTTSGVYYDTILNSTGCDSVMTFNLTINSVDISVTSTDSVLTANAIGANYQWLDCATMNPITGEINQSYNLAANGLYAVIVTQNGCVDTSFCVLVTSVGINEATTDFGILIYPNPNAGLFTIEKPNDLNKVVQVKLLDATAKLILEKTIPVGKQKVEMDITSYSKGIYYLQLIVDDEVFVKQILKD